jgi:hypothetical protein
VAARMAGLGRVVAASVEGEVDGGATPADVNTRCGRRLSNRPVTARFPGEWASDRGQGEQIKQGGLVDLVQASKSPITPALEKAGGGEEKMAARRSLVVARKEGGGVESVRVRGRRKREGSGQGFAWLDQVESVGPSWSGPGLGQTIGPFGPYIYFLFIYFLSL